MRTRAILCAAALLMASAAVAQSVADDVDLSAAVFHGENVSTWPATVPLTGAEFKTGETNGVRLIFDRAMMNARWPSVQVWSSNPADPEDGRIQWTFYACVPVGGRYHCGGVLEFWGDAHGRRTPRVWTGAPWLETVPDGRNNWQANLAYDRGRFGEMADYVPKEGDAVVFLMVAGAVRPGTSNHIAVRERSNALRVRLARSGLAERVPGDSLPVVVPPSNPALPGTPVVVPTDTPRITALEEAVQALQAAVETLRVAGVAVETRVAEADARLRAIEQRRYRVVCTSKADLVFLRVPLSCQAELVVE